MIPVKKNNHVCYGQYFNRFDFFYYVFHDKMVFFFAFLSKYRNIEINIDLINSFFFMALCCHLKDNFEIKTKNKTQSKQV